jgi:hypothetical protein
MRRMANCALVAGLPAGTAIGDPAVGAADQPAVAQSPTQAQQWRYTFHSGEWWYWLPSHRWVYWRDNRWNERA